MQNAFLRNE